MVSIITQTSALTTAMMSAKDAKLQILRGTAPAGLRVRGHLDLSGERQLTRLPEALDVTRLTLRGCYSLTHLPAGLRCFELDAADTSLTRLPDDMQVANRLDLTGCADLLDLPEGLNVGCLTLKDCTKLTALPERMDARFLDVSGCINLSEWPARASLRAGRLIARDCTRLTCLPDYLTDLAQLDVSGCAGLSELPNGLRVSSWLDIAGSGVTRLPDSLQGVRLRWRGVLVDEQAVFRPESITGAQVLATTNVEVRRVLMERMGLERFFEEVNAETLDTDRDPGGERRLLRIPLPNDEDIVCLSVSCPSTGRHYILRVPPALQRCRQAAAWIAGFDNEDEFQPLAET